MRLHTPAQCLSPSCRMGPERNIVLLYALPLLRIKVAKGALVKVSSALVSADCPLGLTDLRADLGGVFMGSSMSHPTLGFELLPSAILRPSLDDFHIGVLSCSSQLLRSPCPTPGSISLPVGPCSAATHSTRLHECFSKWLRGD